MLLLVLMRFLHFGPFIDDPHSWRQADTANYIWSFYQDGIDLLYPSVCWMGGHKTMILEFPLPEALVAMVYKVFGPHLIFARIVFLLFFLGATRYLFLLLRELLAIDLARITVLIYLMLPLSIFYSRAIHIDFSAVFFAHGMMYYFLCAIRRESLSQLFIGVLFASLGMLVKAPYIFYLAFPLLGWTIHLKKFRFLLRNGLLLLLPIVLFGLWELHVTAVNAAAPDWDFIPGYHKFTNRAGWYFGNWEMREKLENWLMLRGRFQYEIVGKVGYWVCFIGFFLHWKRFGINLMRWWAFGTLLYVFVFFNLNRIHDYYQIPLLVPAAFFIGVSIWQIFQMETKVLRMGIPLFTIVILGLFAWNNFRLTERIDLDPAGEYYFKKYFTESEVPIAAGAAIRKHTKNKLTIISYEGLDCRSPHVLYRARRNGWSISRASLGVDLVEKLHELGAGYLVLIRNKNVEKTLAKHLEKYPLDQFTFGSKNWPIRIYDLNPELRSLK